MLAYNKNTDKIPSFCLRCLFASFRSFFIKMWKNECKQFSSRHHFASFIIFTRTKSCVSQFTNGSRFRSLSRHQNHNNKDKDKDKKL